jgi:circadian clock protein KaiB
MNTWRAMTKKNNGNNRTTADFEKAVAHRQEERYVLRLYVTGMTPRSTEAFAAIKAICEEHLQGRYDLEVIDIYQHPELAKDEQIIAVPTLVKKLPAPLRRLIGNLSAEERVLLGLDLRRMENASHP